MNDTYAIRCGALLRIACKAAMAASILMLAGCASFSRDGGMDAVSAMVKERTGQELKHSDSEADAAAIRSSVDALLAQPLNADTAVRIALMNNRGLQASLAELGVSEADLVQAGRLRNPGFSFGKLRDGGDIEIERSVMFDLIGLLAMPARIAIEQRRFEQVQRQAALDAVRIASRTRQAYYAAIAADESARYMEQIKSAADAGAELGNQMARAGNWNKLTRSRHQVFYAEATAQFARCRQATVAAREELTRRMGLWGSGVQLKLPLRLPELPAAPKQIADLERQVMSYRADVRQARQETLALAASLGAAEVSATPQPVALERTSSEAATRAGSVIDNFLSSRDRRTVGVAGHRVPDANPGSDSEQQLIANRLDLQGAEKETQARASSLGLVRATGAIDAFEAGYQNRSASGNPRAEGFELGLELPIFDLGEARNAKAQAQYMQAVHRAADIAVRARSEVREAYAAYRTAYDLARHYRDEIVPLRKKISDEMLLRYNGMLISVFDLLADAREQIGSVNASIEALRDYWVAESNLQMVLTGGSGVATTFATPAVAETKGGH